MWCTVPAVFWNLRDAGDSAGAEFVLPLVLTIFFFPRTSGLAVNFVLLPSPLPGLASGVRFWVESLSSRVEFIAPVSSPRDGSVLLGSRSGVPSSIG